MVISCITDLTNNNNTYYVRCSKQIVEYQNNTDNEIVNNTAKYTHYQNMKSPILYKNY